MTPASPKITSDLKEQKNAETAKGKRTVQSRCREALIERFFELFYYCIWYISIF